MQELSLGAVKRRKQLEELWLKPVVCLDTSLEEIVDDGDDGDGHECM
jgi:hypothetical protein